MRYRITLILFPLAGDHHPFWKPQSDKPRGFGGWPPIVQFKVMLAIELYLKA